jgi:outer membrane protein
MKQKLQTFIAVLLLSFFSFSIPGAMADNTIPGIKFEVALGMWNHKPDGMIQYNGDELDLNDQLSFDGENDLQFWVRLDHPVPVIPNIKIQRNSIGSQSDFIANGQFSFAGINFGTVQNVPVHAEMDITLTDLIFYYHLPFLETVSIDTFDINFGIDLRLVDGKAVVEERATQSLLNQFGINTNISLQSDSKDFSTTMPLLYLAAKISPIDAIALIAEARGISYDGDHWYDYSLELQLAPFVDFVFLGIGYRYMDILFKDVSDVNADQTIQGAFAEIGFRI